MQQKHKQSYSAGRVLLSGRNTNKGGADRHSHPVVATGVPAALIDKGDHATSSTGRASKPVLDDQTATRKDEKTG